MVVMVSLPLARVVDIVNLRLPRPILPMPHLRVGLLEAPASWRRDSNASSRGGLSDGFAPLAGKCKAAKGRKMRDNNLFASGNLGS